MKRLILILVLLVSVSQAEDIRDWRRDWVVEQINHSDIREVAATGSMRPTFDEHYLLLVRDVPFRSLKIGDIIIYKDANRDDGYTLTVHRIWRMSSGGSVLTLKGDHNPRPDAKLIMEPDYVGKVVGWMLRD